MARPSEKLIDALRETANRLETDVAYSWGNLGNCNCGHLTQTLTGLSGDFIHEKALEAGADWGELASPRCDITGLEVEPLVRSLLAEGLSLDDIGHLEDLSDPRVLQAVPPSFPRYLARNDRDHAVAYMRAWADVLSDELAR